MLLLNGPRRSVNAADVSIDESGGREDWEGCLWPCIVRATSMAEVERRMRRVALEAVVIASDQCEARRGILARSGKPDGNRADDFGQGRGTMYPAAEHDRRAAEHNRP
jgi:hypothetical protein